MRRGRAEVAAQHGGAADEVEGDAGRLGDGVGHHALERALAQLAEEEPAEELPFRLGRPGEQPGQHGLALGHRPGPRDALDRRDGTVDVGHRQAWALPPA